MMKNFNQILLYVSLCASVMAMGCAAKKPISPNQTSFRLISSKNSSLLFAPAIPESQASDAPISLTLQGNAANTAAPSECSANKGSFHFSRIDSAPPAIQITLPSPDRWQDDLQGRAEPNGADEIEALYSFLAAVDRSQQSGCFADASAPARDYILQSLPMKPSESLFNAYGYRLEH